MAGNDKTEEKISGDAKSTASAAALSTADAEAGAREKLLAKKRRKSEGSESEIMKDERENDDRAKKKGKKGEEESVKGNDRKKHKDETKNKKTGVEREEKVDGKKGEKKEDKKESSSQKEKKISRAERRRQSRQNSRMTNRPPERGPPERDRNRRNFRDDYFHGERRGGPGPGPPPPGYGRGPPFPDDFRRGGPGRGPGPRGGFDRGPPRFDPYGRAPPGAFFDDPPNRGRGPPHPPRERPFDNGRRTMIPPGPWERGGGRMDGPFPRGPMDGPFPRGPPHRPRGRSISPPGYRGHRQSHDGRNRNDHRRSSSRRSRSHDSASSRSSRSSSYSRSSYSSRSSESSSGSTSGSSRSRDSYSSYDDNQSRSDSRSRSRSPLSKSEEKQQDKKQQENEKNDKEKTKMTKDADEKSASSKTSSSRATRNRSRSPNNKESGGKRSRSHRRRRRGRDRANSHSSASDRSLSHSSRSFSTSSHSRSSSSSARFSNDDGEHVSHNSGSDRGGRGRRNKERRRKRRRQRSRGSSRRNENSAFSKDQRTVFVSQLVMRTTERDLKKYFKKKVGCKVHDVSLIRDRRNARNHKGCAYVEVGRMEDVAKALAVSGQPPDFQRFPILVKISEAEKNYVHPNSGAAVMTDGKATTNIDGEVIAVTPTESNMKINGSNAGPNHKLAKSTLAFLPPLKDENGNRIESQKVYVGGLDHAVTEQHLYALFSQFGTLLKVQLQLDLNTRLSRGYAFLSFHDPKVSNLAIKTMAGKIFAGGRPMKTGWANQSSSFSSGSTIVTSEEFPEDATALSQKALTVLSQMTGQTADLNGLSSGVGTDQTYSISPIASANQAAAAVELSKAMMAPSTGATSIQSVDPSLIVTAELELDKAMGLLPSDKATNRSRGVPSVSSIPTVAEARASLAATVATHQMAATNISNLANMAAAPAKLIGNADNPSRHLLVHNMYDKDEETDPGWEKDIEEEFADECSKFGKIESVTVMHEEPGGKIYASFVDLAGAKACADNLAGRWFDKRQLRVDYMKEENIPLVK